MSAAPLDARINARAQLEHVVRGLYADPPAALRAMRHDAHTMGADVVRRRLEQDFTHYGHADAHVQGPARDRVQMVLRDGGVAADVGHWLTLDHTPTGPQLVRDGGMRAPDAEALGRASADAPGPSPGVDPREGLTAEERLAYDQIEAYAEARERADHRHAAEARLHAINDHRANLAAAETNIPRAEAALKMEVEGVFTDHAKALQRISDAIERDGPAETARRIRSGDLLKNEQRKITTTERTLGVLRRRDRVAEADARERVAKRIETLGYYNGDLGKWGTFQPRDGPAVHGAETVRDALDREEANVVADSGIGRPHADTEWNRPAPAHPSREASQLWLAAQQHLDRLPPEGRERVIRAARHSGVDRIGVALGHLQMIQIASRTFREGIEPGGQ